MLLHLAPHLTLFHTPPTMINITPTQLRKAADIKERIDALQSELNEILGGEVSTPVQAEAPRRKVSAAGRARMRAAQLARWAKIKGTASTTAAPKKNGKMSAAGRAAIRAAQIARWAKIKGTSAKPAKKAKIQRSAAWRAAVSASAKARWAKVKAAGKSRL